MRSVARKTVHAYIEAIQCISRSRVGWGAAGPTPTLESHNLINVTIEIMVRGPPREQLEPIGSAFCIIRW